MIINTGVYTIPYSSFLFKPEITELGDCRFKTGSGIRLKSLFSHLRG